MTQRPPDRLHAYDNRDAADIRPKYVRLWLDQLDALAPVARELHDAKRREDPRITANTLLRVAADVLLEHGQELSGSTEQEIRENLIARLREQG